jgi:hypothetical protein
MKKLMKIPFYIPFIGILVSFILFIIAANTPNMALLITGVILFHLSGWTLAAKYFICTVGFFSTVLDSK